MVAERPTTITIRGPRLLLRALTPAEIDEEWQEMVEADPMSIIGLPNEAEFRARLARSGLLKDGWLDLAIDLDGACIGRIQTFVPRNRCRRRCSRSASACGHVHGTEVTVARR
jgi:hypothetical protein